MKSRVAVLSIIVEDTNSVDELNDLLSSCREYAIGRMGVPYQEKGIFLICLALDAPEDVINSLAGKIGKLKGVSAKTNYSSVITEK